MGTQNHQKNLVLSMISGFTIYGYQVATGLLHLSRGHTFPEVRMEYTFSMLLVDQEPVNMKRLEP